jgi:hypothetical protein
MKLLRLKITDPKGFRSLQPGFEIFFRNERNRNAVNDFNPFVLAGPNGSGKIKPFRGFGLNFLSFRMHVSGLPSG